MSQLRADTYYKLEGSLKANTHRTCSLQVSPLYCSSEFDVNLIRKQEMNLTTKSIDNQYIINTLFHNGYYTNWILI